MLQPSSILQQRYRIEKVIGRGGMGAVYLASDLRLPRQWAIKEMAVKEEDQAAREEAERSFLAESKILAGLNHPNLPHIADFFEENGQHYLVMDYLEGETLETRLERGAMPVAQTLDLALQLANVLEYLHALPQPIVFRDLKPGNVILTPDGPDRFRAKLIDFGIARLFRQEAAHDTRALGTPGYAAPEQYGKGQSDARTDIFALGATLHHCLSGHDPSENPFQFESLLKYRSDVSEALDRLVLRAVSLKPQERFQSVADITQALESIKRDPHFTAQLPRSARTAELSAEPTPPEPQAAEAKPVPPQFEPGLIKMGQLRHGQDACTEVHLRGIVKGRLRSDAPWIEVRPRKVHGENQVVTVRVLSQKLPDAGTAAAHLRFEGTPALAPLRIEVDVVARRRSPAAVPSAVALCLLSLIPLVGWLCLPAMLGISFSSPRSQRSGLWWCFWIIAACTGLWTATLGLGYGLYHHMGSP